MLRADRVVASLIVALLVGLPMAAFADPPDPPWITGYWDDDDYDNVVIAIAAAFAVKSPSLVGVALPIWVPVALVELPKQEGSRTPLRTVASPRAPPVDSPTYC